MERNAVVVPVVTGAAWLGAGVGSIDGAIEKLIGAARREIILLAFSLGSEVDRLLKLIHHRLSEGVQLIAVVERLERQPQTAVSELLQLSRDYAHCHIYDFSDPGGEAHLHAKALIADRRQALIGSANLSWHGLISNHELGVLIEGPAAEELGTVALRLLRHHAVRRIGPS